MQRALPIILVSLVVWLACWEEVRAQGAIHQKVETLAARQVHSVCERCEVMVESKWIPGKLVQADSASVKGLTFVEAGVPRGYQTARVVYGTKESPKTAKVQVFVRVMQQLPVADRRIERHQVIDPRDLQWKTIEITRMRELPISSVEQLEGQATSRLIQKGGVITQADLQAVPVVEPGDNVLMVYRDGGVEVALNCTVREARAEGERVRLHSKETGKTYVGKVLTSSKVVWEKTL